MPTARRSGTDRPVIERTIQELLAFPRNDDEEQLANKHIRQTCRRIRATWSERERKSRIVQPNPQWMPPNWTVAGGVFGLRNRP